MHRAFGPFAVIAVIAGSAAAQVTTRAPRIEVTPAGPVVLGEDVDVRLAGLDPGVEFELVAVLTNEWGVRYRSSNVFVARDDSVIDLGRDAPIRGSYTGADRLGIFWSATRQGPSANVGPLDVPGDSLLVALALRRAGRTVDSVQVTQWLLRPGATVTEIREGGVTAALYRPAGSGSAPLVMLIGGSGGGMTWQRQTAAVLASQGFAALAVAYFGAEGLPAALSRIPLEYFRSAMAIARRMPGVDSTRIGVVGLSRGAEAALLLASRSPKISAVVAFAPSHVAFMGQLPPDYPDVPAWTWQGRDLPFVPTREIRAHRASDNEAERHLRYLVLHRDAAAASVIEVEAIRGPILMFSGGADPIWPSAFMAELVAERLRGKGFGYRVERFTYDSAGHAFARPGYLSTAPAGFSGGNPRANVYAQVDSWRRMLGFLADHLKRDRRTAPSR